MRLRTLIALVILTGLVIGGCTWLEDSWPWRDEEVPVTPQAETDGESARPADAGGDADVEPAESSRREPAPAFVRPRRIDTGDGPPAAPRGSEPIRLEKLATAGRTEPAPAPAPDEPAETMNIVRTPEPVDRVEPDESREVVEDDQTRPPREVAAESDEPVAEMVIEPKPIRPSEPAPPAGTEAHQTHPALVADEPEPVDAHEPTDADETVLAPQPLVERDGSAQPGETATTVEQVAVVEDDEQVEAIEEVEELEQAEEDVEPVTAPAGEEIVLEPEAPAPSIGEETEGMEEVEEVERSETVQPVSPAEPAPGMSTRAATDAPLPLPSDDEPKPRPTRAADAPRGEAPMSLTELAGGEGRGDEGVQRRETISAIMGDEEPSIDEPDSEQTRAAEALVAGYDPSADEQSELSARPREPQPVAEPPPDAGRPRPPVEPDRPEESAAAAMEITPVERPSIDASAELPDRRAVPADEPGGDDGPPPVDRVAPREGESVAPREPEPKPRRPLTPPTGREPEPVRPTPRRTPPAASGEVAAAMLRVNDRYITIDEIITSVHVRLAALPDDLSERMWRFRAEQIVREEIQRKIGEAIVLAEAERRMTDEQKKFVDARLQEMVEKLTAEAGGSRAKLERELAGEGTRFDDLLEDQRRRLTVQTYLREKFSPAISVNRRMLWDYYQAHRDEFSSEKRVRMQIIAVPFALMAGPGRGEPTAAEMTQARDAARGLMGQVEARLNKGSSFEDVAEFAAERIRSLHGEDWQFAPPGDRVYVSRMAEGGYWPMMAAGSFGAEKVERAAFDLAEGARSEVLETDEGMFIVRAAEVEPGESKTFEQAQEQIDETLRQEQFAELVDNYFERLTADAAIVRPERLVELAVERAVERYRGR